MRTEKDFLGKINIPVNALYGINSIRAKENFPDTTEFYIDWYKSVGLTKQACYITYKNFKKAVELSSENKNINFIFFSDEIIDNLILSAEEVAEGKYFEHFIVPAIQGGAGTSINMNVNEIITNATLKKIGQKCGNYHIVSPFDHANIYQSTNDVIPTSLKITVLQLLENLETSINKLRNTIEKIESKYRNTLRIAYTQLQEAVPSSYGMLFSTYNEALSRDWWRVSKCFERIKTVNLGGSAIGTSLTVPRYFVMEAIRILQKLTKQPVTSSENLPDATANTDTFVEIHGILKSHAVNLEKIASDIRLLSSDFHGNKDLTIPQKQTGSSIMPGKVNPVIPEFVVSTCHKIYANDMLISSLASQGNLDLNAYTPTIGHSIINSLKLLTAANTTLNNNLFNGLEINSSDKNHELYSKPVTTTALIPYIGYKRASEIAKIMKDEGLSVFEVNKKENFMDFNKLSKVIEIQNLLKSGFSIKDL